MAKKDDETQQLRGRFYEILRLRAQARRPKAQADNIDAECQRKWAELKEALRAEPGQVGCRS